MARYKTKPCEIEAIQWNGLNLEEIKTFVGESLIYDIIDTAWKVGKGRPHVIMKIKTLEGDMQASEGDYIIKGLRGEFYPCKPDIFQKTYEEAEKTPCHSYQVGQRSKYIFNPITGKNEYTLVSYGFCLGTKECEECSCEGDKSRCNFY